MYFFVVTSKTLCPPKKKGEKRNIKGTIETLLGSKHSWKSNLVLFCGFRLFTERVFEMLLCVDVRLLSFEVKCMCVCVGGVPVYVSCQSACLAPGWGKAPCGQKAGAECGSWGEPPKPQSDKLTAGILGSSYSLTSSPFIQGSLCYTSLFLISNTVKNSPMFRLCIYIATPFCSRMLFRLGWCHLLQIGLLCSLKAHRPFVDWSSSGTNELSVRVSWKAKAKYRIK